MTLTTAFDTARSSLLASGIQSSVISRNIGSATQVGYSRKTAQLATFPDNGVDVAGIPRAASAGLFGNVLVASSGSSGQNALYEGLQKIAQATGDDPGLGQAPAAQLNKLKQALQQKADAPDNTTGARAAATAAKDMAFALNQATETVQSTRELADADMAASVGNINKLLSQFDTV